MRPLVKWAGGKRALLPLLVEAWHARPHRRVVEPFCGSAAFFFAVEPEAGLLGDVCAPLMDFYLALQAFPEALTEAFERLCHEAPQPSEEAYYQVRARYNAGGLPLVEQAAHLIYLNRFCFHGLWRVNARGHMNVSYGHYLRPPIPTAMAIAEVARVLQCATIYHDDWRVTTQCAGEGDFLYLDPPYFGSWSAWGGAATELDAEGYRALEGAAYAAHERGATVVISSRDCFAIRSFFSEARWRFLSVGVVQRIAPQNGGRQPEMLITTQ